jgi:hypothetical protein
MKLHWDLLVENNMKKNVCMTCAKPHVSLKWLLESQHRKAYISCIKVPREDALIKPRLACAGHFELSGLRVKLGKRHLLHDVTVI